MEAHHWYSPEEIAGLLSARPQGRGWRGQCPVHGGDNPTSLSIAAGTAKDGNPLTLVHCHAHQCSAVDICLAIGIPVAGLWCVVPDTVAHRQPLRSRGPAVQAFALREDAGTVDDVLFLLLLAHLSTAPGDTPDGDFIMTCVPARQELWRLVQDHARRVAFHEALKRAGIETLRFWRMVEQEQGGPDAS